MRKINRVLWTAVLVSVVFTQGFGYAEGEPGFYLKGYPGSLVTLKDVGLRLPEGWGDVSFYGRNRIRVYVWDYFTSATDNDYTHTANRLRLGMNWKQELFDLHAAFQYTEIQNLPSGTSAGAGTGSLYRANGDGTNDPHGTYLKYLHLDMKDPWDLGISAGIGRFDYVNAGSSKSKSKKIQWVKSKRVSQRVIGGFGWSDFERSFDGVKFERDGRSYHVNFAAFSPTQGGFEERAGRSIDGIDLIATEVTLKEGALIPGTELQFFHYRYNDSRTIAASIVRQDNTGRTLTASSESDIEFDFFGAHAIGAYEIGPGEWDYLVWGGYQTGDWFELDHKAYVLAVETGYQFLEIPMKPWIRGGFNVGSGDSSAADGDHETFFQMLPTARLYSSSLLYNMMNNRDLFLMTILKPFDTVTVRSDVHWVRLNESADRWYLGAGPVSLNTAGGYAARASGGGDELGTLVDISVGWQAHPDVLISAYYGHFFGEEVAKDFFSTDEDVDFAYMEVAVNF